eukprot:2804098-Prymnesium_polylepis.1
MVRHPASTAGDPSQPNMAYKAETLRTYTPGAGCNRTRLHHTPVTTGARVTRPCGIAGVHLARVFNCFPCTLIWQALRQADRDLGNDGAIGLPYWDVLGQPEINGEVFPKVLRYDPSPSARTLIGATTRALTQGLTQGLTQTATL